VEGRERKNPCSLNASRRLRAQLSGYGGRRCSGSYALLEKSAIFRHDAFAALQSGGQGAWVKRLLGALEKKVNARQGGPNCRAS